MRTTISQLGDVLFGQIRGAILGMLYGRTDQSFYVREIARTLDASPGNIQRELETLTQVGLVVRTQRGNQVFYQANLASPVFTVIRELVAKTVGVYQILRMALDPISKDITVAFVYGSVARGQERAESDLDLMIIGKVGLDDALLHLATAEKEFGRTINPTVYSLAEFRSKVISGNHFITAVLREQKVFLFGDEDELRKVGGIRLAETRAHKSH